MYRRRGDVLGLRWHRDGLGLMPILVAGSEEQKTRYLPRFCQPDELRLAAFGLTEPEAGSDVANIQTHARREGDHYVLNRVKHFITNGGIADLHVIFATLDRSLGHRGITAFIVEQGTPGLSAGKKERKLGIRSSHTGEVVLQDCRVPVENRLGEEGKGFAIAMKTFERARPIVAAASIGVARAAFEYALDYANERVQFGEPIIAKQAIRFMLADMATDIHAARLMTYHAAWLLDQGRPNRLEASMAKSFAGEMAMRVTTDAVQILGGYGYMRDHPVEKWMRDAKIMQIGEGTTQIQKAIISQLLTMG